jgi:uncharacterized protein YbgA (DUF1722 family)/uncharacterized protein YbbK (DUF523 family)
MESLMKHLKQLKEAKSASKKVLSMRKFPIPNVVISKCITFEPVRYNAQMIASAFVEKLKPFVNFIPVCPEIEIGLGVPRQPIRIVLRNGKRKLVQPATGLDFTEDMAQFAEFFLSSLNEVDGFILKRGSPSSGFKNVKIYPKMEKSSPVGKGPGFFGEAVLRKFSNLAIEDELRLLNYRIREHFLTKLFTLASFRGVKKSGRIKELIRFHSENKYLLTAYNQKELRILGKIAANREPKQFAEILKNYETHLHLGLARTPSIGAYINVMLKIIGYFSHQLSKEEKSFFVKSVDRYRAGRLALSANLSVLRAWIVRFKEEYLTNQTFLEPYPEELTDPDPVASEFGKRDI